MPITLSRFWCFVPVARSAHYRRYCRELGNEQSHERQREGRRSRRTWSSSPWKSAWHGLLETPWTPVVSRLVPSSKPQPLLLPKVFCLWNTLSSSIFSWNEESFSSQKRQKRRYQDKYRSSDLKKTLRRFVTSAKNEYLRVRYTMTFALSNVTRFVSFFCCWWIFDWYLE